MLYGCRKSLTDMRQLCRMPVVTFNRCHISRGGSEYEMNKCVWTVLRHLCVCCNYQVSEVHPRIGHKGPEGEWRYSSLLSLTFVLDGGGWSVPLPGCSALGKRLGYPFYGRLGKPQGQSGWMRKISLPPGLNPWTVQPVASRCTDYTIWPSAVISL